MQSVDSNYYELLGVSRDATLEEIKKAYRKQAMKYHPDHNPGDKAAEEMMKKINDAYEILCDSEKRKRYDFDLDYEERRRNNESSRNYSGSNEYDFNNRGSNNNRSNYQYSYGASDSYDRRDWRSSNYSDEQQSDFEFDDDGWYEKYWRTHTTKDDKQRSTDSIEKIFVEYLEKLKKSYNNARLFEKKMSFKKRHDYVNKDLFYGHELFEDCVDVEDYIRRFFSDDTLLHFGTHSIFEMFYIGYKLKKLKTDDFPTYFMRNRRVFAGIFLVMYLLFAVNGNDKTIQPKEPVSITQEYTEDGSDINLSEGYTLNKVHVVESGDSLSKLSNDSNTTINHIMNINDLSSTNIEIGQKLVIPYIIGEDELKYYTTSIEIDDNIVTLTDIAKKYHTDVRTLYSINVEALHFDGVKYIIIADTILVPTFPTQTEVNELKTQDSYQKTS